MARMVPGLVYQEVRGHHLLECAESGATLVFNVELLEIKKSGSEEL